MGDFQRQVVRSWRTASPMELSQLCWSFGLAASAEESQVWGQWRGVGWCFKGNAS